MNVIHNLNYKQTPATVKQQHESSILGFGWDSNSQPPISEAPIPLGHKGITEQLFGIVS